VSFSQAQASLKGGYRSVIRMKAYPKTRLCHLMTPSTKSKRPRGYLPVESLLLLPAVLVLGGVGWDQARSRDASR